MTSLKPPSFWFKGMIPAILAAYPYYGKGLADRIRQADADGVPFRMLVDSGAFTAHTSGKPIDLDKYCDFLGTVPRHAKYIQLDVIGDERASYRNLETMYAKGLAPLPVFTRGSSPETLTELRKFNEYVLLGGMVTRQTRLQYLNWFSGINGGKPIHWLGLTNSEYIAKHRPTSVDSSTWANSCRFGMMPLYVGGGRFEVFTFDTARDFRFRSLLVSHGMTDDEISALYSSRVAWRNTAKDPAGRLVVRVAMAAHLLKAADIYRNFGTVYYFAIGAVDQFQMLMDMVGRLNRLSDSP